MTFPVRVYAIADKYQVFKLQKLAASKFEHVCDPSDDLHDFIAAVHVVDECTNPTDRTLWNVLIPKVKNNIAYLLGAPEFRALIDDMPQLKFDLLMLLDSKNTASGQASSAEEEYQMQIGWLPANPRGGRRLGS